MGTYNNLFAELKERLGGRTNIDSRLAIWLNDAYFDFLLTPYFDFAELQTSVTLTTTADTRNNSLSGYSDLWYILSIRDNTNERLLHKKGWRDLDRAAYTTGQPTKWARFGSTLILDPTPDDEYALLIRYMKIPTELAPGGSTLIGREWDELIVTLAQAKGYQGLEQPEKARSAMGAFDELVVRRQNQLQLEDDEPEKTLGVRLEGY